MSFFRCGFFGEVNFSLGVEDFLRGQIFGEVDFLGTSQWEEGEVSCGGEFFERRSFVSGREFFWS